MSGLVRGVAQALRAALAVVTIAAGAFSTEPAIADESTSLDVGRQVYEKWCAPCHAPGAEYPGTNALAALYKGSKPPELERRTDLTPALVKHFVRTGVSVMPFFRKTEISDPELDALATWLTRPKR